LNEIAASLAVMASREALHRSPELVYRAAFSRLRSRCLILLNAGLVGLRSCENADRSCSAAWIVLHQREVDLSQGLGDCGDRADNTKGLTQLTQRGVGFGRKELSEIDAINFLKTLATHGQWRVALLLTPHLLDRYATASATSASRNL
jgi:hypothetical protein